MYLIFLLVLQEVVTPPERNKSVRRYKRNAFLFSNTKTQNYRKRNSHKLKQLFDIVSRTDFMIQLVEFIERKIGRFYRIILQVEKILQVSSW